MPFTHKCTVQWGIWKLVENINILSSYRRIVKNLPKVGMKMIEAIGIAIDQMAKRLLVVHEQEDVLQDLKKGVILG